MIYIIKLYETDRKRFLNKKISIRMGIKKNTFRLFFIGRCFLLKKTCFKTNKTNVFLGVASLVTTQVTVPMWFNYTAI